MRRRHTVLRGRARVKEKERERKKVKSIHKQVVACCSERPHTLRLYTSSFCRPADTCHTLFSRPLPSISGLPHNIPCFHILPPFLHASSRFYDTARGGGVAVCYVTLGCVGAGYCTARGCGVAGCYTAQRCGIVGCCTTRECSIAVRYVAWWCGVAGRYVALGCVVAGCCTALGCGVAGCCIARRCSVAGHYVVLGCVVAGVQGCGPLGVTR